MTVALRLPNGMLPTSLNNNLFQGCQFPGTVNHSDVTQRRVTFRLRMPPVPRILPQLLTRFLQLGCHLPLQVIPDARLRLHLIRKILEHLPNSSSNLSFIAMS